MALFCGGFVRLTAVIEFGRCWCGSFAQRFEVAVLYFSSFFIDVMGMIMLVVSCGTLFAFDDSLRFTEKTTDSQHFDAFPKHYLL